MFSGTFSVLEYTHLHNHSGKFYILEYTHIQQWNKGRYILVKCNNVPKYKTVLGIFIG